MESEIEEKMDVLDIDHSHCENCVRLNCRSVNVCAFKQCFLNCGATFHGCKEEEHVLLCRKQVVECINAVNGCPVKLVREKMRGHLSACPASVVHCSMEWNRWPVYSTERQARVPFSQDNLRAKYGQLDVALALRDQRMLNQAMKAPRKTRRSLRNDLTRRFPAVPFVPTPTEKDFDSSFEQVLSDSTSATASEDDSDCPWAVSKEPPGLLKSVCTELFGCNEKKAPAKSSIEEAKESKMREYTIQCSGENSIQAPLSVDTDNLYPPPPAPPPSLTLQAILGVDINVECITRYQAKPKSMYTFLCAQTMRRDHYQWHFKNVHLDIQSNLNGWLENRCPLANYGCTYSQRRLSPAKPQATVVYNTMLESFGIQQRNRSPPNSYQYLRENQQRKGKEKTPEIFTSVNCDSILQVDGNLAVDRKFTRDSLSPGDFSFNALPFELLRLICSFLDPFTLSNMSVTSRKMRQVCSGLLEQKGMVVQEWLRKDNDGKPHWYIGFKRWTFGSCFSPVRQWTFNEQSEAMSTHLASCPFYHRVVRTKPYAVATCADTLPQTIEMLQRMYPDYKGETSESEEQSKNGEGESCAMGRII